MTQTEFQEWLKYHRSRYTGLSKFISGLPKVSTSEVEPTRDDVMAAWYYALKDVELEDATAATDAMHRGDYAEPKGWDRHPSAIRAIATNGKETRSYKPARFIDGEQTFSCPHCMDQGWITVWHPKSMNAAIVGTLGQPGTVTTCAVACTCKAGDGHARARATRYNSSCMLALQEHKHKDSELDRLREFVGKSIQWTGEY